MLSLGPVESPYDRDPYPCATHPNGPGVDYRARAGGSPGARRLPGGSGRQPGYGPVGRRAIGRGGDPGAPTRSQHGRHGVFRPAQGFGEHRRFLHGGGARDRRQGLQHRPLYRGGRERGAGRCRTHGALAAESRSIASLECQRGPCHRNRQILRGCGAGIRFAHQQFRGCIGRHVTRACMSMEIPMASSAAIPLPRTP